MYSICPEPKSRAISYSITREKAPIYTMGSPDVRAYSRNKRGIAGSLIWVNFDRHALLNLFAKAGATFLADSDEIRPQYQNGEAPSAVFQSSLTRDLGPSIGATINQLDTKIDTGDYGCEQVQAWYSDQVLPFDVTLAGANEYGAMAARGLMLWGRTTTPGLAGGK
jgi:hypothetical protein